MSEDGATPEDQGPNGEAVGLSDAIPSFQERQIVKGTVVRVDTEGILVDVGAKSEGLIPPKELMRRGDEPDAVAVGDRIDVMVMRVDGEEGNIILSKDVAEAEDLSNQVPQKLAELSKLHELLQQRRCAGG